MSTQRQPTTASRQDLTAVKVHSVQAEWLMRTERWAEAAEELRLARVALARLENRVREKRYA